MQHAEIRTALIASGGGTDAKAIMEAYRIGRLPHIDLKMLISTKTGAACLEKAELHKIRTHIIDRKTCGGQHSFNKRLGSLIGRSHIQLVFLVGCIVKIPRLRGVKVYNIHPADISLYGGQGMYGLEPHKKILADINGMIIRKEKSQADRFYTYPTVHEASEKYDSGTELLRLGVEVPADIISDLVGESVSLETAAERLQKHVLPYEWMMLPLAVNAAAEMIAEKMLIKAGNAS